MTLGRLCIDVTFHRLLVGLLRPSYMAAPVKPKVASRYLVLTFPHARWRCSILVECLRDWDTRGARHLRLFAYAQISLCKFLQCLKDHDMCPARRLILSTRLQLAFFENIQCHKESGRRPPRHLTPLTHVQLAFL